MGPGHPDRFKNKRVWTEVVVNVSAGQFQIARTLDQLSKHQANCQSLNHWLVKKLIGMDRQMEKILEEEKDK